MQFQFSFKQMDSSPALQSYAHQKIEEKVRKFVTKPIEAKVTFSVTKHDHTAHCSLKGGDGFNVEVEHTSGDMYASVDLMTDKLSTQLRKVKDKLKDHKHQKKLVSIAEAAEPEDPDAVDASDILKLEKARQANGGN